MYPSLAPACAGLLKPKGARLGLLRSTLNAENFIRSLSWSMSSHFGAIHYWKSFYKDDDPPSRTSAGTRSFWIFLQPLEWASFSFSASGSVATDRNWTTENTNVSLRAYIFRLRMYQKSFGGRADCQTFLVDPKAANVHFSYLPFAHRHTIKRWRPK